MSVIAPTTPMTSRVGFALAAAIAAWTVFAALGDLQPNGRHLLALGTLRVVMCAALFAFAVLAGLTGSRAGRLALTVTALAAAGTLVGGVGAVAVDGWSYNPFAPENEANPLPWYPYLILVSTALFALGTLVVGILGRRAGWLAIAVMAAGVLYAAAGAINPGGHFIWAAAWFAVALGLATRPATSLASQPEKDGGKVRLP